MRRYQTHQLQWRGFSLEARFAPTGPRPTAGTTATAWRTSRPAPDNRETKPTVLFALLQAERKSHGFFAGRSRKPATSLFSCLPRPSRRKAAPWPLSPHGLTMLPGWKAGTERNSRFSSPPFLRLRGRSRLRWRSPTSTLKPCSLASFWISRTAPAPWDRRKRAIV